MKKIIHKTSIYKVQSPYNKLVQYHDLRWVKSQQYHYCR